MPRRRGLCPRLLATVVRSRVRSAFAAERQNVGRTEHMGYYLQAIVGRGLKAHGSDFRNARVVSLERGVLMIPVTDLLHEEIGRGGESERFEKLSPGVEEWVRRISRDSPAAYIEAEFFGGDGGQSAVVWSEGARVLGPIHDQHAINQALRILGVRPDGVHDEFDAVDLGRNRDTDDWAEPST
jgi:hypothetical protein